VQFYVVISEGWILALMWRPPVILGARIFAAGRNETAFVTQVIAINYVR